MIQSNVGNSGDMNELKLPRRDWILLPMLSVITICVIAGSMELIARRMFSESNTGFAKCMVTNDPSTGPRGIPNCTCWGKAPESQWVEYKFNRCGHRAGMECGTKPPDVHRIVLVGSSVAMGDMVPREQTFAALLPVALSKQTGRKVELYNTGMVWGFPHSVALRFNEALAAQPDMILWLLVPGDISRIFDYLPTASIDKYASRPYLERAWLRTKDAFASKSIVSATANLFDRTRSAVLLRHFLYLSQSQYLMSSLGPGERSGILGAQQGPEAERALQQFDRDAAEIEGRSKVAGVPFVAVMVPLRAQAAMISRGEWPEGFDPYKVDHRLNSIIVSHGGTYIDILPDFRNIPNPEQYYFPVDGHPDAGAHALFARLVAGKFTAGVVPGLEAGVSTQVGPQASR
jgi:hypothetical protein